MDVNELLEILWRRKLLVVFVVVVFVGVAYGALKVITPRYESTATVALRPRSADQDLIFFQTLDAIVPIYASAATSQSTREEAQRKVSSPLGDITIETFGGTPIMKVKARDTDPLVAAISAQAVTDVLIQRTDEGGLGVPSLQLVEIDRPRVSSSPVFPDRPLTLAIGALVGLFLGVLEALLLERLTGRIRTADALASAAGIPCYAEIPSEPAVARLNAPQELVSDQRLRSFSESVRDLRTNLLFANQRLSSVVVTSPEGHHGKTTIAYGLAVSLALAGTNTVLVDADVRRGRVSAMTGVRPIPGLTDALHGAPIEDVLCTTELAKLCVIPRGRIVEDPSELLMTRFPDLLRGLEEQFETIVIDATPLLPINDARIVASYVDTTIVVASAELATRRHLRAALERLSVISVRPAAVVLNKSRSSGTSSYYTTTDPERLTAARSR